MQDPGEIGANWRDEVGAWMRGVFVLGAVLMIATAAGQLAVGEASWGLAGMITVQVTATIVLYALRDRLVAAATVAALALYTVLAATLLVFGPVQGAGMLVALLLVVGVVFFGVRWATLLLLGVPVLTIAVGWFAPPPAGTVPHTDLVSTWVRSAVITTALGGFVLVALGSMVAAFERALAQARAARQSEANARREQERTAEALARARELEALGRLAGGVAHDFNNALTILLAHTEDLLSRDLPSEAQERLHHIDQTAHAAAATAHQLLVFARGGAPSRDASCDPAATVQAGLKNLRRLMPEDVSLVVEVTGGGNVPMSASDLLQVVINLVLNARDACPDGGHVVVRVRPDGQHLVVEVEDDGVGMDDATRARVFEPFFTTKGHRGTGLGMAMVQGTVARCGGVLEVDSAPGKGTRMRVRLPVVAAAAPAPEPPPVASLAGRTAMVVEDDPEIQDIVRQSLAASGAAVVAAGSVEEALAILDRTADISVLCTDGVLRDGTALPVIERFRQRFPQAPILLCSGHVPEELEARGLLPNRRERLVKPFTGSELVRAVSRLLAAP